MALNGNTNEEKIWNYLFAKIGNAYGVSGLMGNLFAESVLSPKNLQNSYEKKLGYNDETYTAAVDNGSYTNFVKDSAGYGLAQWTYWSRKQNLLNYAKSVGKSIGDLEMQLEFLYKELNDSYKSVLSVLKTTTTILQASNAVLLDFERPADQSAAVQNKRASYGQTYYDKYANSTTQNNTTTGDATMSENKLRDKVVAIAISYLGCKESDGSHKKIIDIYNNCTPIPVGYKVKYTDAWCATYVSAMGINAGLHDVILRECGCDRMIELYKKAGRWIENDAYTPMKGDVIFYDWQDNGTGDNTGNSDHVGLVVSVSGTTIKVIEGNISDSVGYRTLQVNGRYIRGYGVPDYASKVSTTNSNEDTGSTTTPTTPSVPDEPTPTPTPTTSTLKYNIGDIVKFTGNTHYVSSNSTSSKACKAGTAKVTSRSKDAKHPYHLVAEKGKGSTVYGWVDEADIAGKVSTTSGNGTGTNNNVNSNAKVDYAQSFLESLTGTYKTTTGLNMRAGAGTSKTILTVIPKGEKVTCYGYYTSVNGIRWYYVTYSNSNGVRFTGFVSSKYLKK